MSPRADRCARQLAVLQDCESHGQDDYCDRGELVHLAQGLTKRLIRIGSPQALHGHGTRGDSIYEDPTSDWLGELDGQVVQVSRQ